MFFSEISTLLIFLGQFATLSDMTNLSMSRKSGSLPCSVWSAEASRFKVRNLFLNLYSSVLEKDHLVLKLWIATFTLWPTSSNLPPSSSTTSLAMCFSSTTPSNFSSVKSKLLAIITIELLLNLNPIPDICHFFSIALFLARKSQKPILRQNSVNWRKPNKFSNKRP